jgi:hypothetical protein
VVGGHEAILDDRLREVTRARSAGVGDDGRIGGGMQHGFSLTMPWLEESRES